MTLTAPRRPASSLAEHWTRIHGLDVFYREAPGPPDAPVMMHVHGFGLSVRHLLPTARRAMGTTDLTLRRLARDGWSALRAL